MTRVCKKHDYKDCPTPCPECDCGAADDATNVANEATLDNIKLSNIQTNKVKYLAGKGGLVAGVNVSVVMLDGVIATINPFGKVMWENLDTADDEQVANCAVFNDYMDASQEIAGDDYDGT